MKPITQIVLALLIAAGPLKAAEYTEEQYVNDVLQSNVGIQASQQDINASRIDEGQVDLQLSPMLDSTVAVNQNRQVQPLAAVSYDTANSITANAYVSQQTVHGTKFKVGLEANQTEVKSVEMMPGQPPIDAGFATLTPAVEVSQSLWQNAWGRSIELQRTALQSSTRIREKQLEAVATGKRLEARLAYARVVFARERVRNAERALGNAQKILDYIKEKAAQNLSETSDLLQAQALVASRDLELKQARQERDEAGVLFNSLRNKAGPVPESLQDLDGIASKAKIAALNVANRAELSLYDEQLKATTASIELDQEKTKPTLEAFASYSTQSTRERILETPSGFDSPYQPNTTIGLRLNMVLDRDLVNKQLEASHVRKQATELRKDEQRISLQQDLNTLLVKRKDSLETLNVAERLETLQRKKLANEQKELRNGRSTTYQILTFTQDLANAEFAKLQVLYSLKIIDSQLRMYERNPS